MFKSLYVLRSEVQNKTRVWRCHDVSFSFFDASWICHFVGELLSVSVLLGLHSCGVITWNAMKLILCNKAWLAQTFVRRKLHSVEVCWFYCILVPLGLFWLHACFYDVFLSLLMSLYYILLWYVPASHKSHDLQSSCWKEIPIQMLWRWLSYHHARFVHSYWQQPSDNSLLTGCAVHRSRLTYR